MDAQWWAEVGLREAWEHDQANAMSERAVRLGLDTQPKPTKDSTVKISQMMESKYLKRSDLDEHDGERVVTIVKIGQGNIARDDEAPELKWMVRFKEFNKPMVLNTTNIQLIAQATGSDDTDDWIGKTVVLYDDPNVSYGGKLTGGLRIKRVRTASAGKPAQQPRDDDGSVEVMDDDIPF